MKKIFHFLFLLSILTFNQKINSMEKVIDERAIERRIEELGELFNGYYNHQMNRIEEDLKFFGKERQDAHIRFMIIKTAICIPLIINTLKLIKDKRWGVQECTREWVPVLSTFIALCSIFMNSYFKNFDYDYSKICSKDLDKIMNTEFIANMVPIVIAIIGNLTLCYYKTLEAIDRPMLTMQYGIFAHNYSKIKFTKPNLKDFNKKNISKFCQPIVMFSIFITTILVIELYFSALYP